MAEYIVDTTGFIEEYEIETHEPEWAKERIVRCRDCKHSFVTRKGKTLCVIARHVYYDLFREVNPNGFCAWAERREGE